MQPYEDFQTAYRALEARMKALAEADGDVFLPNLEPKGPVAHVLICMEPSLGRWARSADLARSTVEAGFRNFLPSDEVAILHFCIRRYLCSAGEQYHMTDFSKGAMLVERAAPERTKRYERWYPLLLEEIELVSNPTATIVAVGAAVFDQLTRQGFRKPFARIMHYSSQAVLARREAIVGREDSFNTFSDSVSLDDVINTAKGVFRVSCG